MRGNLTLRRALMPILLSQAPRGPGVLSTRPIASPVAGQIRVFVRALMDASDVTDSTLVIPCRVEQSADGTTWVFLMGGAWHGGGPISGQPRKPLTMTYCGMAPAFVRAVVELPHVVNIGLEGDLQPWP